VKRSQRRVATLAQRARGQFGTLGGAHSMTSCMQHLDAHRIADFAKSCSGDDVSRDTMTSPRTPCGPPNVPHSMNSSSTQPGLSGVPGRPLPSGAPVVTGADSGSDASAASASSDAPACEASASGCAAVVTTSSASPLSEDAASRAPACFASSCGADARAAAQCRLRAGAAALRHAQRGTLASPALSRESRAWHAAQTRGARRVCSRPPPSGSSATRLCSAAARVRAPGVFGRCRQGARMPVLHLPALSRGTGPTIAAMCTDTLPSESAC
jgi:hypothetical protein